MYVPCIGFEWEENYKSVLEILGICLENFVPINDVVQYSEIIVPDKSFYLEMGKGYFYTESYRKMINDIRLYSKKYYCENSKYRKVYFTYSQWLKWRSVGEVGVERYFRKQGYCLVAPETLSFEEQLQILANCESFASTTGSCAHNSVFLRDDCEVILIPRRYYMTGYQEALNQLWKHNVVYISCDLYVMTDLYFYYISSELKRYFHNCPRMTKREIRKIKRQFWLYLKLGAEENDVGEIQCDRYNQLVQKLGLKIPKKIKVSRLAKRLRLYRLISYVFNQYLH